MTLRIEPAIKAAAEIAAERDRRSLTSLVEVLILNHCEALQISIDEIETEPAHDKEDRKAP
ncbi:hypothetical protein LJR125_003721 [Pseudoxanthomonas sp. LjRoot125]|uniref:hypothetical protein n=1 Tax=Pseudoxanthomonas sp. LjRoot125 TaxID=3342258 RepID=UPI003E11D3C5